MKTALLAVLSATPFLSLSAQQTAIHRVAPDTFWNTLWRGHPVVARIKPGDIVITKTLDAGARDERNVLRAQPFNPMVGPIYIEGAEPGDAIAVNIRKIRPNRGTAWSFYRLGAFALTPAMIEGLYPNAYKADLVRPGRSDLLIWDVDTTRGTVKLREPVSARHKLEFPMEPMLGVVGVAPAGDYAPTSGPSREYGGNMDFNEIREGSTVLLPVFHLGALLFVADGHALMGDGEPTGAGIETSMDVEFSIDLRKRARLSGPRVITAEYIISVGSQAEFISPLDRGVQLATSDMIRWLTDEYKMEPWAAHMLIGAKAEYEIVTIMGSAALKIAKRWLPSTP
ncbi:MAG: acetamidase/formamidase family protein [Gemmatimonadaceae bacterium]